MAKHSPRNFLSRLLTMVVAGLLAGCSLLSPKPDFAHYYRLDALPAKISPAPPPDPTLVLAVYPPDLPGYLDRPQMVTVMQGDQVGLDEYHRWAESLDGMFSRVLAQDIALLSDSTHIAAFPLSPGFDQEFEVYAQVQQFDGTPGGIVTLRVSWRITGPGGKPSYIVHESVLTRQAAATADPAEGYIEALNGLVGDLAKDIVGAVPEARAAKAAHAASSS